VRVRARDRVRVGVRVGVRVRARDRVRVGVRVGVRVRARVRMRVGVRVRLKVRMMVRVRAVGLVHAEVTLARLQRQLLSAWLGSGSGSGSGLVVRLQRQLLSAWQHHNKEGGGIGDAGGAELKMSSRRTLAAGAVAVESRGGVAVEWRSSDRAAPACVILRHSSGPLLHELLPRLGVLGLA